MPARPVHRLGVLGLLAVLVLGCREGRLPRAGASDDLSEVLADVRLFEARLPGLDGWDSCDAREGRCLDVLAPDAPWIDGLREIRSRLRTPLDTARLTLVLSRSRQDLEGASRELERAAGEGDPVEVELAFAYWLRAERGEPARLLEALEWVERALERDPRNLAALFDRALFLARLGLPEADDAWRRYLEVETQEPWQQEARRSLGEAGGERRVYRSFSAVPAGPGRPWFSFAGAAEVLAWADAVLDASDAARRVAESELGRAAEASAAAGDTTAGDVLSYLSGAPPAEARRVAEAVRFSEIGLAGYATADLADAHRGFEESSKKLEGLGFPLEGWVRHYLQICRYWEGDRREAPFLELRARVPRGHRSLRAYIDWMLGLLRLSEGRYDEGFELYLSALDTFTALGSKRDAAHLRALLADAATELGEPETAFEFLAPTLREVRALDPRIAKLVHQEAGETAEALGHDPVALRFFSAAIAAAEAAGGPLLRVEALVRRAQAFDALGAATEARADLEAAEEVFGRITDEDARRTAEVSLLEARSRLAEAVPGERLAALAALSRTRSEVLLPRLLHLEALEELARGDAEAAADKLLEAVTLLDRQARECGDWQKRHALVRRSRRLLEELVRVRLDRGSPDREVANAVERALHAAYLAPYGVPVPGVGAEAAGGEEKAVAAGEVELSVLSLEERTVLVVRAGQEERVEALAVSREELLELGSAAGVSPGPDEEEREARLRLARILLAPAAELATARVLRLVLDPELAGLPMDLLPWPAAAGRRSGETGAAGSGLVARAGRPPRFVHSLPGIFGTSAQAAERPGQVAAEAPFERAVVVGNPAGAADLFGRPLRDLADAAEEAREVGALYVEPVALVGDEATAEAVVAALQRPGTEVFSYGGHAVIGRDARSVGYLALAEGSHLYGDEIARLELPELALVVLAGCEAAGTGGAGVTGLAVPFLLAGAEVVVASSLPLKDGPAREVFVELHRRVREGGSVVEAVAEVRRRFLAGEDREAAEVAAGLRVFERR